MHSEILQYNQKQPDPYREICDRLSIIIDENLHESESKVWHGHPVWFLEQNPVCGYSKLKSGIRLMFWSGPDFEEEKLQPGSGKFKDASILYTSAGEIDDLEVKRWLEMARYIQWDYKNLVKRKGKLERLK